MVTARRRSESGTTRRPIRRRLGTVRVLADRLRIRVLLRLPGRRSIAVTSPASYATRRSSTRRRRRRGLSPQRRLGRRRHRLAANNTRPSARKTVLHVLGAGAVHGPHHIFKEWADKYKGRFDDGWDKYRERAFARQGEGLDSGRRATDAASREDGVLG